MLLVNSRYLALAHGTFIGSVRLEANKPTQLQINSQFSFGASTRHYILRERPTVGSRTNIMEDIPMMDISDGTFLGLPESQTELDVRNTPLSAICRCILLSFLFFVESNRIQYGPQSAHLDARHRGRRWQCRWGGRCRRTGQYRRQLVQEEQAQQAERGRVQRGRNHHQPGRHRSIDRPVPQSHPVHRRAGVGQACQDGGAEQHGHCDVTIDQRHESRWVPSALPSPRADGRWSRSGAGERTAQPLPRNRSG